MHNSSIKPHFFATVTRDGREPFRVDLIGRVAWAVLSLMRAGKEGCTPISRPAPRWSDYVFRARALRINIETIDEKHAGSFAGMHARYVLRDTVEVFGGNLDDYLNSEEGRREFGRADFARAA